MASRDKVDVDTFNKGTQYTLEKQGKSKFGLERTEVSNFNSTGHVGSGNEIAALRISVACNRARECNFPCNKIAILIVTSPIVINVPTRGLLAVKARGSFTLWLAKFKDQKTCL